MYKNPNLSTAQKKYILTKYSFLNTTSKLSDKNEHAFLLR